MSGEATTVITDLSHRQPSRRKLLLVRLGSLVGLIAVSPVALVLRARFRPRGQTAFDVLDARVREIWQTSPAEAVALLRSTGDQLLARNGLAFMKVIEIEPFGKFKSWDALAVQQYLFNCEITLGRHEEALAVAALLPKHQETILQQVDCLVALGRRPDAVALLERNLDIDGWRGTLRRRLVELGGRHLRALK